MLITTPVLRAAMADVKELPFDSEPAFCCCEFTDRHGNRAHGLDAGGCDTFCNALCDCQPQACKEVISDCDDRLRLPMYGGSLHAGFEGAAPALLLPILGRIAARGPLHALAAAAVVPPIVLLLHWRSLKLRHRSRFFIGWTFCTFGYCNLYFTIVLGEQVPFGLWVLSTSLQVASVSCFCATRGRTYALHSEVEGGDESGEEAALAPADEEATADPFGLRKVRSDGAIKCAMSGVWVRGYDHHCIWLDTAIGAHNLGTFVRGCAALAAAVSIQGALCAERAQHRRVWGAEAVLATYGAIIVVGLLALLMAMVLNLSRGVTAYEARRRRRRGQPLPPMRCDTLCAGLKRVSCE